MLKSIIISSFLSLALLVTAHAQRSAISDPGYSPHNYKHPNKANTAKEMKVAANSPQQFVIVNEYIDIPLETRSNYKVPRKARRNYLYKSRNTKAVNVIVVEADENPGNDSNDGNYYKENTKIEN